MDLEAHSPLSYNVAEVDQKAHDASQRRLATFLKEVPRSKGSRAVILSSSPLLLSSGGASRCNPDKRVRLVGEGAGQGRPFALHGTTLTHNLPHSHGHSLVIMNDSSCCLSTTFGQLAEQMARRSSGRLPFTVITFVGAVVVQWGQVLG